MRINPRKNPRSVMQSVSKIETGMKAPEFTAQITSGKTIHLRDYKGKKVVLYFYPKDDTPGCTVEACGLRDEYQKIRELNAEVLGVSVDNTDSHQKFTNKFNLPFPLVADPDKSITKSYGVLNDKSGNARRVTFIIDEQGKIAKIFETVKPDQHPQEVLDALKA